MKKRENISQRGNTSNSGESGSPPNREVQLMNKSTLVVSEIQYNFSKQMQWLKKGTRKEKKGKGEGERKEQH